MCAECFVYLHIWQIIQCVSSCNTVYTRREADTYKIIHFDSIRVSFFLPTAAARPLKFISICACFYLNDMNSLKFTSTVIFDKVTTWRIHKFEIIQTLLTINISQIISNIDKTKIERFSPFSHKIHFTFCVTCFFLFFYLSFCSPPTLLLSNVLRSNITGRWRRFKSSSPAPTPPPPSSP